MVETELSLITWMVTKVSFSNSDQYMILWIPIRKWKRHFWKHKNMWDQQGVRIKLLKYKTMFYWRQRNLCLKALTLRAENRHFKINSISRNNSISQYNFITALHNHPHFNNWVTIDTITKITKYLHGFYYNLKCLVLKTKLNNPQIKQTRNQLPYSHYILTKDTIFSLKQQQKKHHLKLFLINIYHLVIQIEHMYTLYKGFKYWYECKIDIYSITSHNQKENNHNK